jgi:endonuclease/exonuclease/phosphatase family metal-dependent hydrolase
MDALWAGIEPRLGGPLLVAGDFNLPADSAWFDGWRDRLTNAFEAAGRGWYLSWPSPFPVLALDHAWVSPSVEVVRCELRFTTFSDHRPILLEIRPRP